MQQGQTAGNPPRPPTKQEAPRTHDLTSKLSWVGATLTNWLEWPDSSFPEIMFLTIHCPTIKPMPYGFSFLLQQHCFQN